MSAGYLLVGINKHTLTNTQRLDKTDTRTHTYQNRIFRISLVAAAACTDACRLLFRGCADDDGVKIGRKLREFHVDSADHVCQRLYELHVDRIVFIDVAAIRFVWTAWATSYRKQVGDVVANNPGVSKNEDSIDVVAVRFFCTAGALASASLQLKIMAHRVRTLSNLPDDAIH
nr:hypothetical protein [Tanacetum cinerariifolium]